MRLTLALARLVAVAAVLLVGAAAEAIDLRSWDQKISDPTRRFVVLSAFNNEAVLDKETQLVWERTPNPGVRDTYSEAIDPSNYDNACFGRYTGARGGWRVPSIHELATLFNGGSLPAGHPFINIASGFQDFYWSVTLHHDGTRAYVLYPNAGNAVRKVPLGGFPLPNAGRVLCVRGPGGDASQY